MNYTEDCDATIIISTDDVPSSFYKDHNLRIKWTDDISLKNIQKSDLHGKLVDTACEDRHNFVCAFTIEINEANSITVDQYGERDQRLHGGRYFRKGID